MPSAELLILLHEARLDELRALRRVNTEEYREIEAHIKELRRWSEKILAWE